jgi:protein phosphatase PTC7
VLADGVGGWRKYNIDALNYAKGLCERIFQNYSRYQLSLKLKTQKKLCIDTLSNLNYLENTQDSLLSQYSETFVKKLLVKSVNQLKVPGSSTCTIILLNKNTGVIYSNCIGDSLYMILKYNNMNRYYKHFKSKEQMHIKIFNSPFQVGTQGDSPELAHSCTHDLEVNDIIITASDG